MFGAHRSFEKTMGHIFPSAVENRQQEQTIGTIIRKKIFSAYNKLKDAFIAFDLNNDGYVSKEEFISGITTLVGNKIIITDEDINNLFQLFSDVGNNVTNKIQYFQFCIVLQKLSDNNIQRQQLLTPVLVSNSNKNNNNDNNSSPYLVYNNNSPIEQSPSSNNYMSPISTSDLYTSFDSTSTIDLYTNDKDKNMLMFDTFVDDNKNWNKNDTTLSSTMSYYDGNNYNNDDEFDNNFNTIINTNDTLDTNNFRNEFDISYSESLSYVEMPIPDIMLRIADFVFSTSKKLREIFKSFDLNNDGYISKTELINGLASIGIDINMRQAVDLINEYSTESVANNMYKVYENTGKLKYYQFCNLLTDSKNTLSNRLTMLQRDDGTIF